MTYEYAPRLLICNLKSKLTIYKQRVSSSVPLQLTEEAPLLVFQSLLRSLLRTLWIQNPTVDGSSGDSEGSNNGLYYGSKCGGGGNFDRQWLAANTSDMVHANVWHKIMLLFVPIFTNNGLVTSQDQPQHTTNCCKHGDHGGGAAHLSSNKDLINPPDLSCGRPKGGDGRGNRSKKSGSNTSIKVVINIFLSTSIFFYNIPHPPMTMVAKMASIVIGRRPYQTTRLIINNIIMNVSMSWF